jgi:hypothetical protein
MLYDNRRFSFTSFMAQRIKVISPSEGAMLYGRAIKNHDTGESYSNMHDGNFINIIPGTLTTLTVYIPDSMDKVKHKNTVFEVVHRIYKKYGIMRLVPSYEKGQECSYDGSRLAYSSLIIASIHVPNATMADIEFFIGLGKFVKRQMKLESIAVGINDAIGTI